jgi:hypothetical protein
MISRTESQKIFIETRDGNIGIEPIQSVPRSALGGPVPLQIARQKDKVECIHILRKLKLMKGNHRTIEMSNEIMNQRDN